MNYNYFYNYIFYFKDDYEIHGYFDSYISNNMNHFEENCRFN